MTEQVMPGPDVERTHPLGLAGLAFEAHLRQRRISLRLRLRPEGLSLRPSFGGMRVKRQTPTFPIPRI
jgi:hypothetical protein